MDAAGLKSFEETRRLRDLMFLWAELDERALRQSAKRQPTGRGGGALLFMVALEDSLPVRMRLCEMETYRHELNANRMTKRELLKALHEGWRALGMPKPRGALPPSQDKVAEALKPRLGLLAAFSSGKIDHEKILSGDVDAKTLEAPQKLGFRDLHTF
jgi:hypothetical protein